MMKRLPLLASTLGLLLMESTSSAASPDEVAELRARIEALRVQQSEAKGQQQRIEAALDALLKNPAHANSDPSTAVAIAPWPGSSDRCY